MDFQLEGKTALITGASRGIGEGTAKVLAGDGVKCVISARRMDLLEQLANDIEVSGGVRPIAIPADLFERDATRRLAAAAEDALGHVDILVNSAGRSKHPDAPRHTPFNHRDSLWDDEMHLNYNTIRQITFALLPGMIAQKYGRIINITGKSEPEKIGTANPPKAAVHAWAKGVSRKVAKDGVTINSIPPGKITSEQIQQNYTDEERAAYSSNDITLGYFGEPEDIGHLIAYLASPLGNYITGTVIPVDGGFRKHSF
jgi:3-oxoacyl-[acyl-carrier protein] reductase